MKIYFYRNLAYSSNQQFPLLLPELLNIKTNFEYDIYNDLFMYVNKLIKLVELLYLRFVNKIKETSL